MRDSEKRTHRAIDGKSTVDPYDLPRLPTRILLRYLRSSHLPWYYFSREPPREDDTTTSGYRPVVGGPVISFDDIKAELSKREHVMNKLEGYMFRRSCARCHHGPRNRAKKLG